MSIMMQSHHHLLGQGERPDHRVRLLSSITSKNSGWNSHLNNRSITFSLLKCQMNIYHDHIGLLRNMGSLELIKINDAKRHMTAVWSRKEYRDCLCDGARWGWYYSKTSSEVIQSWGGDGVSGSPPSGPNQSEAEREETRQRRVNQPVSGGMLWVTDFWRHVIHSLSTQSFSLSVSCVRSGDRPLSA